MNDSTASYRYTETDSDPDIGKEVAVANCGRNPLYLFWVLRSIFLTEITTGVRESHSNAGINRTQTV